MVGVHVVDDGRDLRVLFQERVHEVPFRREHRLAGDEDDHDLARVVPDAYLHMPEEAPFGVLVVRLELEALGELADGDDDLVRCFVLDETVVDRHDPVGSGLVHAGDEPLVAVVVGEGRLDLAPVVGRVLHTEDGRDFRVPSELAFCRWSIAFAIEVPPFVLVCLL